MKKKWYFILASVLVIILILSIFGYIVFKKKANEQEPTKNLKGVFEYNLSEPEEIIIDEAKIIKLNAVGDCTIGIDPKFGYSDTFNEAYDKYGASYFFKNMQELFTTDDLTIANLEGTFTDSNEKIEKAFNFKGPKNYVDVLTAGSIEVVNIANNHTYDYGDTGYNDTISTLENAKINYFGYDNYYIFTKDNLKIGLAGFYTNYDNKWQSKIDKAINYFKEQKVNAIIMSFHWGIEKVYNQNDNQREIARYAIDNGVDLVLGHHPHYVQGIETYKNKYIVYSLGNFVFGGNRNPIDKDTFIFHADLEFKNQTLTNTNVKILPAKLSGVNDKNNYQPIILTGEEKTRVLEKMKKFSTVPLED